MVSVVDMWWVWWLWWVWWIGVMGLMFMVGVVDVCKPILVFISLAQAEQLISFRINRTKPKYGWANSDKCSRSTRLISYLNVTWLYCRLVYELMTYFSHYLYKNVNNTQCEDDNLIMLCGITILFEKKYPIDFFVTTFISDFRHGGNNITLHH